MHKYNPIYVHHQGTAKVSLASSAAERNAWEAGAWEIEVWGVERLQRKAGSPFLDRIFAKSGRKGESSALESSKS